MTNKTAAEYDSQGQGAPLRACIENGGPRRKPLRQSRSLERLVLWVLGGYWLAMFIGTHVPHVPQVGDLHPPDYVLHFGAYFGLAFLMAIWCQFRAGGTVPWQMAAIVVVCMVYGALDELTQIPVGRHAALGDWLADTVGAIAGVLAAITVRRMGRLLRR